MNHPTDPHVREAIAMGWPERNRHYLSTRFALWRRRLDGDELAEADSVLMASTAIGSDNSTSVASTSVATGSDKFASTAKGSGDSAAVAIGPGDSAAVAIGPDDSAAVAIGPDDSAAVAIGPDDFQPAAQRVAVLFGLSEFELQLLLLAAGIEIDSGLREAVARAQAASESAELRLSFSLALSLLDAPHWDALSPTAPLRHWSLVTLDTRAGLVGATLRIDEHVLHHLTGIASVDPRLAGVARLDAAVGMPHNDAVSDIAQAIGETDHPLAMLAHAAADAAQRRHGRLQAIAALTTLGLRTLWVDTAALASTLGADARELDAFARHLDREAALEHCGIAFEVGTDGSQHVAMVRVLGATGAPAIALGSYSVDQLVNLVSRVTLRFNAPASTPEPTRALSPALTRALDRSRQQFRVEPALLEQALNALGSLGDEGAIEAALWDRLREAARGGLDALAQRIESTARFEDLVVPSFVAAQLHDIASQLRHRHQVYETWGFGAANRRGLGIAALFAGESGTGKTLAAEAIANEARLDLYRIDLASVVSKYIGETEKNLSRVFNAAEASGAVLLFDEADALFGKRSEVKDSHDRYANIEVAFLLQRIESYRGLAILTSNMKSALDRSFLRRIRFVVQFPFPDVAARTEIWRRQFPPAAPREGIDLEALARLQLSGGNIRSVVLNAAFKAAARNGSIDQALLVEAAHAEHAKLDRSMRDVSLRSAG